MSGVGVQMESGSSIGDEGLGAARSHQHARASDIQAGLRTRSIFDREGDIFVAVGLLFDGGILDASSTVNHIAFLSGLSSFIDSVADIGPGDFVDVPLELPLLEFVL